MSAEDLKFDLIDEAEDAPFRARSKYTTAYRAALDNPDQIVAVRGLTLEEAIACTSNPSQRFKPYYGRIKASRRKQVDGSYTVYLRAMAAS